MKKQPTITDIIMLAGGAFTVLFSFFNFVEFGDQGESAWGDGNFPLVTIPAILGLAMVVFILLEWFAAPNIPRILTFDVKQMYVTWGITAAAIMLTYFVVDKGGLDTGIGAILSLLGSLAMATGSILNILGIATTPLSSGPKAPAAQGYPGQPGYPPQPGQYPQQQGGYPPQPGQYPPQQGGYPPAGQAPPPPPAGGPGAPPPPPPPG